MKSAELGASVVALELEEAVAADLRAELKKRRFEGVVLHGDVSESAFLKSAFEAIASRWGRLDGWVNNAFFTARDGLEDFDMARFTRAWEVNVRAVMEAAVLGRGFFQAAGGGAIVNISSVLAHRTRERQFAYTSSKAGMEGLTRALAFDLASDNVRVNCVIPGAIQTTPVNKGLNMPDSELNTPRGMAARAMHDLLHKQNQPMERIGKPLDIANAVIFLLSNLSAFITGTTLAVDGGYLMDGVVIDEETVHRLTAECEVLCAQLCAKRGE